MPQISSADLNVNEPVEAAAPDATLAITIDPNAPLPVGVHVFQLVVEDDAGNRSQPVRLRVTVLDDAAPTAVLTGPERVPFGRAFTLSGEQSTDAGGGRIARFIWTLVG